MKKKCLYFFSLLMYISCSDANEKIPDANTVVKTQVSTIKTVEKEIIPTLTSFGSISFRSKADITSTVDGTLTKILVEEGDVVKKGQLLATLSNIQLKIRKDQAQSSLESAKSAVELAETKLYEGKLQIESRLVSLEKSQLQLKQKEREFEQIGKNLANQKELFAIGGATEEDIISLELSYSASETELLGLRKDLSIQMVGLRDEDILNYGYSVPEDQDTRIEILKDINTRTLLAELNVSKSQLNTAKTELQSAIELMQELNLKAPIDGIVGAKYLELGERVKADTKVFTVFDSTMVDISFPVPENKGILLTKGLKVEAVVDALDNSKYEASIRQISPMIDPQSGNITIKASLSNREGLFKPGMFSRVKVEYGNKRKAILVPESSIVQKKENNAVIFLTVNNHVFKKQVVLGEEFNGNIEIIDGIKKGDLIIDNPSPLLREGEEVEIN
ncbi:efflux RND transporter periplasmic adaptor subunit [Spirochaeta cellobiosiphila]|uniref:efflux RND transporter periplasmic adaptor subunit n=1 Tax=Spirochaeta cellobiosiphila TaxID=504483 RepID=UPI00040DB451|nr:efflux RND transporter periplasmic adaptor subunit [Spirochaeta cellobiosiphila]